MRWRRDWPEREPRPKVRKLSADQANTILRSMNNSIKSSPVLSALKYRARSLRGRFYYERTYNDGDVVCICRATPLARLEDTFLLEKEYGKNTWSEIAKGKLRTITNAISADKKSAFHGLGVLDKSIRAARKNKLERFEMVRDGLSFAYVHSEQKCSVQEILFHYFNVPIEIIARPRRWYMYHRVPYIVEVSSDETAILTYFTSSSISGEGFGGACLYLRKEGMWNSFTIKPNQSKTIESSIDWLKTRKWVQWE
jgi:hypothetical protein